jgi:hypothetical protein
MKLILKRIKDNGRQTTGKATLYDGDKKVFEFVTLEPAWLNNAIGKSCIPAGIYNVRPRRSAKYGNHFIIEGTEPRTYVLFHKGNYRKDSTGCILVGRKFADINGDGEIDITSSGATLKRLLSLAPNGFKLEIIAP